jgi:hypothetical protein
MGWRKRDGQELSNFPCLSRWLDTVLARPAPRGLAARHPASAAPRPVGDEEARGSYLASGRGKSRGAERLQCADASGIGDWADF